MAGPTTATVSGLTGTAAIMAFMPFGVSFETVILGAVCFFAGSCARTGLVLYKKLDGNDPVPNNAILRVVAQLLCTTPLAGVASCVVFLAAHVIDVEADAAFGGLLLIMGVRGPEGFQWIMDAVSSVFTKFTPGNKGGTP